MEQFNNPHQSHAHSLETLKLLNAYDDFMDSVTSVADMGCGHGLDIDWFARNEFIEITEDENGNIYETLRPRNYRCYAIDKDPNIINTGMFPDNVHVIRGDFEKPLLSRPVDLMWCHNSFQYVTNPMATLKVWNEQLVENGMLILSLPLTTEYEYNRLVVRSNNYCYYNHNFLTLVYMLAVNGFDCRDAYFLKRKDNPWMQAAVYKSHHEPMVPSETSWYDLAEKNLINDYMKTSLHKYGYLRQEDIVYAWLDKDLHYIED